MAQSLFQKLEAEAYRNGLVARSTDARKWFKEQIRQLGRINRNQLLKDSMLTPKNRPMPGHMYMYFYDPKGKDTLPYYDQFPLTLMIGPAPGGFYGLNLHYLNPVLRAKLLDKLMETASNRRYDESTKLRLNYNLLSKTKAYREFEPCFKHYLLDHVQSRVVKVDMPEWDIAMFLPTESFKGANKNRVWSDSKKAIYKP